MSIKREFMDPEMPPHYLGEHRRRVPSRVQEQGMRLIEDVQVRHVHGRFAALTGRIAAPYLVQNLDPNAESLYVEEETIEGRPFVLRDGTEILVGAPRWIQDITGLTLDENARLSTEVDKLRESVKNLQLARFDLIGRYNGLAIDFQEWRDRAWVTGIEVVLAMLLIQLALGVPG